MSKGSNNPPFKSVDLTEEQYEFLLDNCDSNLEFGLKVMQTLNDKDIIMELILKIEMFKEIKKALKGAA